MHLFMYTYLYIRIHTYTYIYIHIFISTCLEELVFGASAAAENTNMVEAATATKLRRATVACCGTNSLEEGCQY